MANNDHPAGTQADFDAVEQLIVSTLVPEEAEMTAVRARADEAGLPRIEVMPNHGKLLQLLAQVMGARRVLEIGTLGGYSTIWLARGVKTGGKVVSLELEARHAEVALQSVIAAGLANSVEIRVGDALETLGQLRQDLADGAEPFDLVFIDADKESIPAYIDAAVALARPGTVIVLDNAVWHGEIVDPQDDAARGVRAGLEAMGVHPQLQATAIQTVGSKGWDGFALAVVSDSG